MHGARKIAIAALWASSIVLVVAFAASLVADLYGIVSAEQRSRGTSTAAAVSAAQHATLLQPWRPGFHADLGWVLGLRGDITRMRTQYQKTLRYAPASAYAWLEYAQALARSYWFDAEYTIALRRATTLAPNARPVQVAAARMGSRNWNLGGDSDRRVWAQNMSYVLRTAPSDLLWTVLQDGREETFCGFVGSELGLSRWCFAIRAARTICDSLPNRAVGPVAEQCAHLGLVRSEKHADEPALEQ